MEIRYRVLSTLLCLIALSAAPVTPPGLWPSIQARMDKAASEFKSMTAQGTYVTHTEVLNEDSPEPGKVVMKKVASGEVQGLIDFTGSDKHSIYIENRLVRLYYPKINTVQEFDLGKHGEQLDQFLLIGFGTSGTSIARDYTVSVLPNEPVKGLEGIQTIRLRLVPKAEASRKYVTSVDLWIPETGDPYPRQEKISQPSGDYKLITYTALKTNQPLAPDALQLKTKPGVITEHPGRK
jgi:outer membrane lipoprotein-sorting protein